jgi:uncharacterized protein involved in response to NO
MTRDPYRVFFPLGILFGLAGVAIWPAYSFGLTATYSGRAHAMVQTYGFLYAFIAGFLLTAVPRFTGTEAPSRATQYSLAGILVASVTASELRAFEAGTALFVVAHLMLLTLLARRFVRRTQNPPPTFAHIGFALVAGLAGALLTAGVAWELMPAAWDLLGKRLLTEGMVMLLVLGVGGFLGPRLLGFAPLPQHGVPLVLEPRSPRVLRSSVVESFVAGLVVLISLVAEYGFDLQWMAYIRAAAVSAVVVSSLQLWRRPAIRTTLSWTIWTAHWVIASGVWIVAAAPKYRADFLHFLFVGGFSLLILAIGTRVTLSHGGHDLSAEQRSWPLRIGLTLGLIAMLARIGAPFASATYFDHLMWAALLWIGGMICWGGYITATIAGWRAPHPPPAR